MCDPSTAESATPARAPSEEKLQWPADVAATLAAAGACGAATAVQAAWRGACARVEAWRGAGREREQAMTPFERWQLDAETHHPDY